MRIPPYQVPTREQLDPNSAVGCSCITHTEPKLIQYVTPMRSLTVFGICANLIVKVGLDRFAYRPRLKLFRQKVLSGHRLTVAQKTSQHVPAFDSKRKAFRCFAVRQHAKSARWGASLCVLPDLESNQNFRFQRATSYL